MSQLFLRLRPRGQPSIRLKLLVFGFSSRCFGHQSVSYKHVNTYTKNGVQNSQLTSPALCAARRIHLAL
jgi:hypothetical protein